jgi:hypothetical protein
MSLTLVTKILAMLMTKINIKKWMPVSLTPVTYFLTVLQ